MTIPESHTLQSDVTFEDVTQPPGGAWEADFPLRFIDTVRPVLSVHLTRQRLEGGARLPAEAAECEPRLRGPAPTSGRAWQPGLAAEHTEGQGRGLAGPLRPPQSARLGCPATPRPPLDPVAVLGSQGGSHCSPGHLGLRPADTPPSCSLPTMRRSGDPICPWRPLRTAPKLWGRAAAGSDLRQWRGVEGGEGWAQGFVEPERGHPGPEALLTAPFRERPQSGWDRQSAHFPSDFQASRHVL